MRFKQPRHFTKRGLFLGLVSPIIIYIADFLGIPIPYSPLWAGVYIFGVVPYLLALLFVWLLSLDASEIWFTGTIVCLQVLFAWLIAVVYDHSHRSDTDDVGVLREQRAVRLLTATIAVYRIYTIAFWIYSLTYFVIGTLRAAV